MTDPVEQIAALFAGEGMRDYLGEAVSLGVHMLQAGALAEADGAPEHLVAAALLHDVGHFRAVAERDTPHQETGAAWLDQWFPEEVTQPVRLHVAAKRYLCSVDPDYLSRLSPASVYTLGVQGGPMNADQALAFASLSHAAAAVAVRRWDEAAKDPAAPTPHFDHFRPVLRRVLLKL